MLMQTSETSLISKVRLSLLTPGLVVGPHPDYREGGVFGVRFTSPLPSDCSFLLGLCLGRKQVEEREVIVRNREDFVLDRSDHKLALCVLCLAAV